VERQKLSFRIKARIDHLPADTPHPQRQNGPARHVAYVRLGPIQPNGPARVAAKVRIAQQ